jgi:hypothetical protein
MIKSILAETNTVLEYCFYGEKTDFDRKFFAYRIFLFFLQSKLPANFAIRGTLAFL